MKSVTLNDVVGLSRYAQIRDEFRRRVIEIKRNRRLSVGDRVTFVFESFDTVLFQIQEMLFVERITDLDKVRDELEVYNTLIPGDGEISTTMLIEITDQPDVAAELARLIGIDEHVTLSIAGESFPGRFEAGRSNEEKLSAVQYVRFKLSPAAQAALSRPGCEVVLQIDHPGYRAQATIPDAVRASLAGDFHG